MQTENQIENKAEPTARQTSSKRIAFVQACWHRDIVDQCKNSFVKAIKTHGEHVIDLFEVPGAFEIPLQAKRLANSGQYAAVVAAGLVVDGGIYRHEFVAQSVISGLMQVQLETDVPVFSAVLTPHHFHGSAEHIEFFTNHFVGKGTEVAGACLDILQEQKLPGSNAENAIPAAQLKTG